MTTTKVNPDGAQWPARTRDQFGFSHGLKENIVPNSSGYPHLVMALEIWERKEGFLCLDEVASLDGVCWATAVYMMVATSVQLLLFIVSFIWGSPAFVQDQMSGGAFFSRKVCIQSSMLCSFSAVSVIRRIWWGSFHRGLRLSFCGDTSRAPS